MIRLPMWLRITLLIAIAGWSLYIAIRREDRLLRRLARAARGSVWRALAVVTGATWRSSRCSRSAAWSRRSPTRPDCRR
ncbi:hypothetical protein BJF90_35705 [Pseudonocardia sp. CNS-004]|nr:hypothetical protein BJF90_35705 [Pseudonocardia sp. CNS-004]